jgi:hypothetical protein
MVEKVMFQDFGGYTYEEFPPVSKPSTFSYLEVHNKAIEGLVGSIGSKMI